MLESTAQPTTATKTPQQSRIPMFALGVAAVVSLIWGSCSSVGMYQANQVAEKLRVTSAKQASAALLASANAIKESRRQGIQNTADAAAAALAPFLVLRGQVPEITDRSLQSVVQNLVLNPNLRFVAITDSTGKVLASSDLTMVGREATPPSGLQIARSQIGSEPPVGSVLVGETF